VKPKKELAPLPEDVLVPVDKLKKKRKLKFAQPTADTNAAVIAADDHQKLTDEDYSYGKRMATIGQQGLKDPLVSVSNAITAALDPHTVPAPCKTLADMTPEEKAKMVALYGPVSTQSRLDTRCNSFFHRGRKAPLAIASIICPLCSKVLTGCAYCQKRMSLEKRLEAHVRKHAALESTK